MVARPMDQALAPADIPAAEVKTPEPKEFAAASTLGNESRSSGRRRVRQSTRGTDAKPDWEQTSVSNKRESGQGSPILWIVGASLLGLSVVAVGAWLLVGNTKQSNTSGNADTEEWKPEVTGIAPPEKVELTEEEKKTNQEIQDSIASGNNVLEQADDIVKKFLSVRKVEDFEALVRFPETTMPKIRKWYKKHHLEPTLVKEVGYGGRVTVKGKMASLALQMDDYSLRQIALERTKAGYRVDWESWVSWTEMDWDELFDKRPVEPVTVMVRCSLDTYYNRYFRDDSKWLAVKMTNPGSDRTLYGYVDRGDPTLMRLIGDLGANPTAAILKIRYPKDAVAGNQAIITKHILNGWVAPSEADAAEEEK